MKINSYVLSCALIATLSIAPTRGQEAPVADGFDYPMGNRGIEAGHPVELDERAGEGRNKYYPYMPVGQSPEAPVREGARTPQEWWISQDVGTYFGGNATPDFTPPGGIHAGEDWNFGANGSAADLGMEIYPIGSGVIEDIRSLGVANGHAIVIRHPLPPGWALGPDYGEVSEVWSIYVHVAPATVNGVANTSGQLGALEDFPQIGSRVFRTQAEPLCRIASIGEPHLHLEVRYKRPDGVADFAAASSLWPRSIEQKGYYISDNVRDRDGVTIDQVRGAYQKMFQQDGILDPSDFIDRNRRIFADWGDMPGSWSFVEIFPIADEASDRNYVDPSAINSKGRVAGKSYHQHFGTNHPVEFLWDPLIGSRVISNRSWHPRAMSADSGIFMDGSYGSAGYWSPQTGLIDLSHAFLDVEDNSIRPTDVTSSGLFTVESGAIGNWTSWEPATWTPAQGFVRWQADIPTPNGGRVYSVEGMNDAGSVVGTISGYGDWQNQVKELFVKIEPSGTAHTGMVPRSRGLNDLRINNRNQVVGLHLEWDGLPTRVFSWTASSGLQYHDSLFPPDSVSQVFLNDHGFALIAGQGGTFLWKVGSALKLNLFPMLVPRPGHLGIQGFNNRFEFLAWIDLGGGDYRSGLYRPKSLASVLPQFEVEPSEVKDMNVSNLEVDSTVVRLDFDSEVTGPSCSIEYSDNGKDWFRAGEFVLQAFRTRVSVDRSNAPKRFIRIRRDE